MTVYVDNFRAPATVGRLRARWSHLTADTPEELEDFAISIGLKREWYQRKCSYLHCPTSPIYDGFCRHFHFDVTDAKRNEAIKAGAISLNLRDFGAIVSARRDQFTNG